MWSCCAKNCARCATKLGADSQRRIETNPLRVLDSKIPEEQPIIERLPRISDHLAPHALSTLRKSKSSSSCAGIAYERNWRLVRGLDYYTRTTFEIVAPGLGSQNVFAAAAAMMAWWIARGPPTKELASPSQPPADAFAGSGREARGRPALDVFIVWMGRRRNRRPSSLRSGCARLASKWNCLPPK